MKRLVLVSAVLVCSVNAAWPALGCSKEKVVRIAVPPSFRGQVHIPCSGLAEGDVFATLDAAGRSGEVACPKDLALVIVTRNGIPVVPEPHVAIYRTGDGIPTGFTFTVEP